MNINIKLLNKDAKIPQYANIGDAGLDLIAIDNGQENMNYREYDTGVSIEIPDGYVGLVFPRSSISNTALSLSNAVGIIDSKYRGSIKFRFRDAGYGYLYQKGDKIGQLMILPYPKVNFVEVKELSSTERGEQGFGSTDKK